MNSFAGYKCSLCQSEYPPKDILYTCPEDGGNLDVILDLNDISQRISSTDIFRSGIASLWRYAPLLPVKNPENTFTPLYKAGFTPVYEPLELAKELGINFLAVKDESPNPTASFKDRASAIVVQRSLDIDADVLVTASTGNAGAALAGMAAAVGQKAVIFAPRSAPPAKVAQLLVYGAQVLLVDGNYDDAFDLTIQAAEEFGWYCRNTGYNPFTAEGKKTAAFEIWEWIETKKKWNLSPNQTISIFISVGDGNIISGIHKGFKDLYTLGWIENIPRLIGVQAEGSAAIANAFFAGNEQIIPVSAQTIADSISVNLPRDGIRAVRAAVETGGFYLTVSDNEILNAITDLGRVGIFAEPAGAAAYAGLVKAVKDGFMNMNDRVIVLNTGSGLKDVRAAEQAAGKATIIEPTLSAVKRMIK